MFLPRAPMTKNSSLKFKVDPREKIEVKSFFICIVGNRRPRQPFMVYISVVVTHLLQITIQVFGPLFPIIPLMGKPY